MCQVCLIWQKICKRCNMTSKICSKLWRIWNYPQVRLVLLDHQDLQVRLVLPDHQAPMVNLLHLHRLVPVAPWVHLDQQDQEELWALQVQLVWLVQLATQ